ncbi:MAG: hypothetical protein WAM14_06840 [Candidatus Nitrosopolaris sp.]
MQSYVDLYLLRHGDADKGIITVGGSTGSHVVLTESGKKATVTRALKTQSEN